MELSHEFMHKIKVVHKEKGEEWLKHFKALYQYCEKRWSMRILAPYQLSFNFAAPAILSDGTKVVLKLVVPGDDFVHEVEALKLFSGNGIARLIDSDMDKGIIILECITPGEKLAASIQNDEAATTIICDVMKKLWIPALDHCQLPTTSDMESKFRHLCDRHPDGIGPFSKTTLSETAALFKNMNDTMKQKYVLHGDLHHYNILSSDEKAWIAIDPHGVVGEREYDVIFMFWTKLPSENLAECIEKRINILVNELKLNEERLLLWGICHNTYNLCGYIHNYGNPLKDIFEVIMTFRHLHQIRYGQYRFE
jgi:streptomycin 6-kinase